MPSQKAASAQTDIPPGVQAVSPQKPEVSRPDPDNLSAISSAKFAQQANMSPDDFE